MWNVCMAFYQTALFCGYLYAYILITRVSSSRQLWIHGALVVTAFALLPMLPAASWKPDAAADPGARILAILIGNVGLPFVALAGTGPIVQALFARRFPNLSPYPLYALSNFGSLLALLCFPLVVEPWLPLSAASPLWSGAFVISGAAVLTCLWLASSTRVAAPLGGDAHDQSNAHIPTRVDVEQRVAWLLLPACAVVLLMGVTNLLCLDVASVPLLWVVPLALYLSTFILCFASTRNHCPWLFSALASVAVASHAASNYGGLGFLSRLFQVNRVLDQVLTLSVLLFSSCMLLHGVLQRRKPAAQHLTTYYLMISGGGALGGLFVGLLAPVIFDDYDELPLGLLTTWIALGTLGWRQAARHGRPLWRRLTLSTGLAFLALLSGIPLVDDGTSYLGDVLLQKRSFFGVIRVYSSRADQPRYHAKLLLSGSTLHGRQSQYPPSRLVPTSYYGPLTAIGMTLYDAPFVAGGLELDDDPARPGRRIGIIGIGVGTLAGYGRPSDRIVFYEIDPEVISVARDSGHFDYLGRSRAEIELVLGDARLSLERELKESGSRDFAVLVLDGFSSDAIPTHLLTREAFGLYEQHLATDGVLAVHVSNRNLRLAPLVARVGESQGLHALRVRNRNIPHYESGASIWVMLARDESRLDRLEQQFRERIQYANLPAARIAFSRPRQAELDAAPLWTDDYSNILGVLNFGRQRGARGPGER